MDPTQIGELLVALVDHRHVRSGIGLGLAYLGVSTIQGSAGIAEPQQIILIALGIAFAVGGGGYVLWRLWDH